MARVIAFFSCAAYLLSLNPAAADLTSSQIAFADDLTDVLYDNTENQCSSALGVSMMLSLLYPSMQGESKTQTEALLGFSNSSEDLAWDSTVDYFDANYIGDCLDEFQGQCYREQPIVSVANSVWINTGAPISSEYESVVSDILFETDFNSAVSGTSVNAWVQNATRGLIDSVVDNGPLSPWILLAVNAIYLKASWQSPFMEFSNTIDKFYEPDKLTVTREETVFLHQVSRFPYSHTALPGYQVVRLPFQSGGLSMIVVQPTSPCAETVTSAEVLGVLPEITDTPRVALALPRFELETTYSSTLKQSLMDLGLTAPFQSGLCVYEGDCSPFLDVVIQKTYISVDEEGVEAAAVTAGAVATSFPTDIPIEFLANSPFQFFIYDENTNVVLFEGRIVDPEPHATYTAQPGNHSDPNFWLNNFGIQPEVIFDNDSVLSTVTETPTLSPVQVPRGTLDPPTDTTSGGVRHDFLLVILGVLSVVAAVL